VGFRNIALYHDQHSPKSGPGGIGGKNKLQNFKKYQAHFNTDVARGGKWFLTLRITPTRKRECVGGRDLGGGLQIHEQQKPKTQPVQRCRNISLPEGERKKVLHPGSGTP